MTWIRSEPGDIGRALICLRPAVVLRAMHDGVFGVSTSKPGLTRMDADNLRLWCGLAGVEAPTADDLAWVSHA